MARKKKAEPTQSDTELDDGRKTALARLASVCDLSITFADLGEIREAARLAVKELETRRKSDKQPHLDACREVDARYRAVTDVWDQVIKKCDELILASQAAQRTAVNALVVDTALTPIEKHEKLTEVLMAQIVPGGVKLRVDYDYEVVDFEDVPREYLTVDDKRIRATLKETCGTCEIPGIKVIRRQKVSTR